jgi:predicted N-acyltransferase
LPSAGVSIEPSVVGGVTGVPAAAWDALVPPDDPFLEHAFLSALERSGSVGRGTGWLPRFVLAHQGEALVGALPLYLKDHSYGEFIFDWGWANAAHRAGLNYYPKLVAAVPFTPATGRRLLVHPGADPEAVQQALLAGVAQAAERTEASSVHVLFCTAEEQRWLAERGYAPRLSMQFHWTNRPGAPYTDFEDFLGAFRSRNRKQVHKERRVAAAHGLRFATRTGDDLTDEDWRALERFYRNTVDRHGNAAYLTPAFFAELRATLRHRVVATLAYAADRPVAGTLNFERGRHLYGRYWGCDEDREMLHFELCYYALIDRAIARGHTRFEAGAQGEHKLKRGLEPAFTYSAHWVRHPGLAAAVEDFVRREARAMEEERAAYADLSPYARREPT